MKRLAELTLEDLTANPVWRYEGGSGAEALVAPAERDSLSQSDDEIFLAATDFELSDSSRHLGFCFPADDSGIDYLQPVIVSGSPHVSFWFEGSVSPAALASQWSALGKQAGDIFPVTFQCRVPVDGRTVTGRITGVESSQTLTSGPAPAISNGPGATESMGRILTARPVQARRDTGAVEKRTARRRKAEMTVEFVQDTFHGTGVIADLSRRGMFVRSNRIPGTGPALRLTVDLPNRTKIVLTGRVIRTVADPSRPGPSGFGLRLAEDSPEYEALLSRLRNKPQ
ncbi:MAG: PilZ domain-containing protein [Thermoanaerobaculia bacterium]